MIDDVALFLAHSVRVEADAAESYDHLAAEMESQGNAEVAALLRKFGGYSRQHLAEATERAYREAGELLQLEPGDYRWPDGRSPEKAAAADLAGLTVRAALEIALGAERQACDFYAAVAGQTASAAVQELAQEFAEEEAEHVEALERWLARLDADAR